MKKIFLIAVWIFILLGIYCAFANRCKAEEPKYIIKIYKVEEGAIPSYRLEEGLTIVNATKPYPLTFSNMAETVKEAMKELNVKSTEHLRYKIYIVDYTNASGPKFFVKFYVVE